MSIENVSAADLPDVARSNHGKTPAAWVTNIVISVGSLVGAYGVWVNEHTWLWVGIGVMVAGGVAGLIMRMLGYGQPAK